MKLIDKVRQTAGRLKMMARRPTRKHSPQKLQARVRAAVASTADAYDEDEPQTKLTSAFVVVLILHVVAVGGIYAFNQIKAARRSLDTGPTASSQGAAKSASATEPVEPASTQASVPAAISAPPPSTGTLSGSDQRVYNVRPKDNLISIAKTFGTTVSELKAANSLESDSIRPGQVLNLPRAKSKPVAETAPAKRTEASEAKPTGTSYTVKSGDRLIFIAKKFSVSQEELMAYNKISDPNKLHVGQTLKIPKKK